tara:strand:+ start:82 stop:240 length:159 start_codon:yes stop_codon:yes gene_type:complete
MAPVAPIEDAKDITATAVYTSKINPERRPRARATGIDKIVRRIYVRKYKTIK